MTVEFHQVVKNSNGEWRVVAHEFIGEKDPRYFNLQVTGREEGGHTGPVYRVFCDEQEFSSLEYGDRLFHAVALHVLTQRKSGQCYPIYITDVDLSPKLLGIQGPEHMQSVVLLDYKRKIEDRLNQALLQLVEEYRARASSS